MAFPLTIHLGYGQEKVETSSQKQKLGTRAVTPDGRVFYYAEASGTAITTAGQAVNGIAAVAAHDMDLAGVATSVNSLTFTTSTSLTVTKNQYKDGYAYVNDGAGDGEVYRIKSNTAVASATGLELTVDEPDGIRTAMTTGTRFGLMYSPYKDIHIVDGDGTQTTGVVGITTIAVTADYFCWVQTAGPAAVLIGAQVGVVGDGIVRSQADEDGTLERTDYSDEADLVNLGVAMGIPAVATDFQWVMLNIRS